MDWKLWLVAAVESVIHRIPKNSNQSNSRQLLHTWVIPLWVKGCPLRDQGPIGTFFTFWVPLYCSGSLFSIYFCKYLFWVPIFAAEGLYFVPIGSLLQGPVKPQHIMFLVTTLRSLCPTLPPVTGPQDLGLAEIAPSTGCKN